MTQTHRAGAQLRCRPSYGTADRVLSLAVLEYSESVRPSCAGAVVQGRGGLGPCFRAFFGSIPQSLKIFLKWAGFLHQQLRLARLDHRGDLPATLGNRIVLPLDQAAPAVARLLGDEHKRSQRANLGRNLLVPARGDRQERNGAARQPAPDPANSVDFRVGESASPRAVCRRSYNRSHFQYTYPNGDQWLPLGQAWVLT